MSVTSENTDREVKRARLARWLKGDGIEIGAAGRRLPMPSGARVRYVDRMTVEQFLRLHPECAGEDLVEVDILGDAEDLSALESGSLDFVVANHLLEHLENPLLGLREMLRVVRAGGVLYLTVPDQRVGIDHYRSLTSVQHLLTTAEVGVDQERLDHFREWVRCTEPVTDPESVEARVCALDEAHYPIHFHTFRPETFLEFLIAVRGTEGLDFELGAFAPAEYPMDDDIIAILVRGRRDDHPTLPPAPQRSTARLDTPAMDRRPAALLAALSARARRSRFRPLIAPPYRATRRLRAWLRSWVKSPGGSKSV